MSIKILTGDVRTRRSLPACPVAIKNSQQSFQSGAGDSPINTDIPPQRAMHAKRAPYPSDRRAGVYLQLGGYEDRHGEKCHLLSPLAVLTPFCCEVGAAGVKCPPPPPPPAKGEDDPGGPGARPERLPLSSQGESITQTLASPPQGCEGVG